MGVEAQSRRSEPTPLEQKEIRKQLQKIYRRELGSRDVDVRRRLVRTLLSESSAVDPGSVEQFVFLTEAAEVAQKVRDVDSFVVAIDRLNRSFEIDALDRKLDGFDSMARGIRKAEDFATITRHSLKLVDSALRRDDFKSAGRAAKSATLTARRSKDPELSRSARARRDRVEDLESEFAKVKPSIGGLIADENDASANLAVGRYVALFKEDWKAGLPLLAKSGEGELAEIAKMDLTDPVVADEQWVLAKGWLDFAKKASGLPRRTTATRSLDWYAKAVAELEKTDSLLQSVKSGICSEVVEASKLAGEESFWSHALILLTFDGIKGAKKAAHDFSGRGNHGVAEGVIQVPGKVGESLRFDGDGFVDLSSLHEALMDGLTGLTLSTWVKSSFDSEDKAIIFDVGRFSVRSVALYEKDVWRFRVTGGDNQRIKSRTRIDGEWHHVVGVWDGRSQRIYVDGRLEGSMKTKALVLDKDYLGSASPRLGSMAKRVGRAGTEFKGELDEFAIFSRALSENEVRSLYLRGVLGRSLARH